MAKCDCDRKHLKEQIEKMDSDTVRGIKAGKCGVWCQKHQCIVMASEIFVREQKECKESAKVPIKVK